MPAAKSTCTDCPESVGLLMKKVTSLLRISPTMDESRREAYLDLIDLLLNCPSGEEAEIVNSNLELVDTGLVQIMEEVADYLAQEGEENNATWLRNIASDTSDLGKYIANSHATAILEVYLDFLMQVLKTTKDNINNPQKVYQLLQDNLDKLNDNFAYVLRDWATAKLLELELEQAQAQAIAAIIFIFSGLIQQFAEGSTSSNLEIAIVCHEVTANVFTREAFPLNWAVTKHNLGNAYVDRINGDKSDNLEAAIGYYESALEVYTCKAFPQDWARIQNSLGNVYLDRIKGDKSENLEAAIACYLSSVSFYTPEKSYQAWAINQRSLGNAYCDRINGDKAENLEAAIACYLSSVSFCTPEKSYQAWAINQRSLGNAYCDRINGDKAENLETAIGYYQAALEVFTREAFPQDWGGTQHNLGNVYLDRIKGDKAENLETAIGYYESALEVLTREAFPQDWAMIQNSLGNLYSDRIKEDKANNLETAICHYKAALEIRHRDVYPQNWATTQNNLANTYRNRINEDKSDNLEAAIACYLSVLEVYTPEAFPQAWAITQNNLAIAYVDRIKGDKTQNLETAIACYKDALKVYTREAFPQSYVQTLFNLGLVYQKHKQNHLAYDVFADAIETIELMRYEIVSGDESKQKLAEQYSRIYQYIVEVCLEMGKYTTGIEYAERSKTRNLVEQILTRDLHKVFPLNVVKQIEKIQDEIATNQNKIQSGKADNPKTLSQRLQQLRQQRNDLQNSYLPIGHSFKFNHLQATLDDRTAIIEWYITPERFHTFIVTRQSPQPFVLSATIDDRNALTGWVDTYINHYYESTDNWRNQLTPRLQELAKILHLDEILSHLPKDCQQLILIPHRYLHLFPLHALPFGELCLLDLFPKGVSYAPSCQLLLQAQKRKRPDFTNLFAIQNPTKDRPYVDFGVEAIRPYFQPNDYVLAGDKAIKANLIQSEQLRSAHCFHFFGHATFNFEKSALILADGHLTLGEIFALDLNQCRLVILSACETGMTDFNSISDEYIGLPSGFLFAGSPSVVSTLWEVDQLSAAFLMIEFYENLRKYKQLKEGDIAIALNLAQKRLRDLTVDEFKKRLVQYKPLIDEILSKLPISQERREADASITYFLSQAYPFAHPSDWAAFTATGI
ncbi:CHAT domain-containing protein [Microcoleus sp.]|uniref:CHAT domain-containing protein n=1 Tax=Microcoleus sp. TaxID=44472 RepID=UPI0035255D77